MRDRFQFSTVKIPFLNFAIKDHSFSAKIRQAQPDKKKITNLNLLNGNKNTTFFYKMHHEFGYSPYIGIMSQTKFSSVQFLETATIFTALLLDP